jgi:heme-degrading monooxygenase HmoA
VPGFVSVERFRSLTNPGKLLSLSFWEDEAAVRCWRPHPDHRESQAAGRGGIFAGYRLRVAAVLRDYAMAERREQAPEDSLAWFA